MVGSWELDEYVTLFRNPGIRSNKIRTILQHLFFIPICLMFINFIGYLHDSGGKIL
jgi:hypothetical protein